MAKITKTLSSRQDSLTGRSEIMFRFTANRKQVYRAKSGIFIHPKQWNEKKGELKTASFGQDEAGIRKALEELCSKIMDRFLETPAEDVDKEWLQSLISNYHKSNQRKEPNSPSEKKKRIPKDNPTWNIIKKFISTYASNKRLAQQYEVVLRILQRYEKYAQKLNKKYTLNLEEINAEDLHNIKDYIINEHTYFSKFPDIFKAVPESRAPKPRGNNTIQGIFKKIRAIVLWSIKNGYITNNPFTQFKITEGIYGTPYYITIAERNIIYSTPMKNIAQEEQRDIFVFQCLIGCRVGDLLKLTKDSVINGVLEYIPRKTKDGRPVTVKVPLNNTAQDIVDKYKDIEGDKLLPFISSQNYNENIKAIFVEAGITRKVTVINPITGEEEKKPLNEIASSHLARRTFVGNLYKQVKDPSLVGALSGHKEGSRAFARYREIDDEIKKDLVQLLEEEGPEYH